MIVWTNIGPACWIPGGNFVGPTMLQRNSATTARVPHATYTASRLQYSPHQVSRSQFYPHGLTLIPAWISSLMLSKVWDEITYLSPNFNGATIGVWEWISNFIAHFIMDVITFPCWNFIQFMQQIIPCGAIGHVSLNIVPFWFPYNGPVRHIVFVASNIRVAACR